MVRDLSDVIQPDNYNCIILEGRVQLEDWMMGSFKYDVILKMD